MFFPNPEFFLGLVKIIREFVINISQIPVKLLLSFLICFSLLWVQEKSYCQSPADLSGEWTGTSTFLKESILTTYSITQDGAALKGFITTQSLNGKDSVKMKLQGVVNGKKVVIRGTDFIYKVGGACLSKTELSYSKTNERETLTGRWKGDWQLNTCPPGVSGKVTMQKLKKETAVESVVVAARSPAVIETSDFEGNALVEELSKRKYYALLIGVDSYGDESIPDLDQPIADALRLREALASNYTFDKDRMIMLQNPTRSAIIEQLDVLSREITERDNLLVFYAGHGIWDEQLKQGYWLPANASMHTKSEWISNSTIRDYIGGIPAKHTLLISDACFSGGIFKERAVFNNSRAILEMYKLPSRKAMTSGTLKTVPDKSVFIEYLIKNLVNAEQPLLSADQLFQNFKVAVINNSPNGQVPQYGPIGQAGDEGGDFIFLRRME